MAFVPEGTGSEHKDSICLQVSERTGHGLTSVGARFSIMVISPKFPPKIWGGIDSLDRCSFPEGLELSM